MFKLFQRKSDSKICAPLNGRCLDIAECTDIAFSSKTMGDGFIILPSDSVVCSPCDGKLTMIFPTKHAFGVTMDNGNEVLVHIGIDTVNLNGEHFRLLTQVGSRVKKGMPVIDFDCDKLRELGYDTSVLVILTGAEAVEKIHLNEEVYSGDIIIEE